MKDRLPFDLAMLPGARLWSSRVLRDLREGRNCLLLFPERLIEPADGDADRLLEELLGDLGNFLVVPTAERPCAGPPRRSIAAVPPGTSWSGLEVLHDYDDGLSLFGSPRVSADPIPPSQWSPPIPDGTELTERLAKELLPGDAWPPGVGALADEVLRRLIAGVTEPGGGRVVVVRAWREAAPAVAVDLMRQLAAAVKEAGLSPERRPQMVVVAVPSRLPSGLPEQVARENVAVHWWWGALGRLDTATVVSMARPERRHTGGHHRLLEAVAQATAVEICGPFLGLAASLAAEWEGDPERLVDHLRELTGPAVDGRNLPARNGLLRGSGPYPEPFLREEWDRALVQLWGGQVRRHPAFEVDRVHLIRKRIWLAQNHALLPLLDDAREAFTEVIRVRARIPMSRLADEYGPRTQGGPNAGPAGRADAWLACMELGDMWGAHKNGHLRLARTEADRLRLLWNARNLLAHRTALDFSTLGKLVIELCSR